MPIMHVKAYHVKAKNGKLFNFHMSNSNNKACLGKHAGVRCFSSVHTIKKKHDVEYWIDASVSLQPIKRKHTQAHTCMCSAHAGYNQSEAAVTLPKSLCPCVAETQN